MIKLSALIFFAVTTGSVHLRPGSDALSQGQTKVQYAPSPEGNGDAPTKRGQVSIDGADSSGSMGAGPKRGQPRVSKTRCSFVSCGSRCDIQVSPAVEGGALYRAATNPKAPETMTGAAPCGPSEALAAGRREAGPG